MATRNDHRTAFFWITECIALGPFLTEMRARALLAAGVTHVLNVSDAPSIITARPGGFTSVRWMAIEDVALIPDSVLVNCLDILNDMLRDPNSKAYVHCIAGQNRSPTVLWLFLIACGIPPREAKEVIESRSPDAVAGHPRMCDQHHVTLAQEHGAKYIQPVHRREIVIPATRRCR